MKSSDLVGTQLEDNSEENLDSEFQYIGQKELLLSKLMPELHTLCKNVENTVLNVERKDVITVLEDYQPQDTDVLKDVEKVNSKKEKPIVNHVKDTVVNVNLLLIVTNVSSQDTYMLITVLEPVQKVWHQRMVIVSKDQTQY